MKSMRKKLTLLLVLVCTALCCVALAACGEEEPEPDNKEQKVTYSVTVTCEAEELTLSSLKAQWLRGNEVASEEIALDAEGKASVELAPASYMVTLKGVPEGYEFEDAFATVSAPDATIELVEIEPITYTLTVTAPEALTLSSLKAQWLKGDASASEEIALDAEGKASAELLPGNYAVTLKGVPEGYAFENASVTAESTGATIAISLKSKTVSVNIDLPEGVSLPEGVKVQAYVDGEPFGEPAAIIDGIAAVTVPEIGDYTAALVGELPDYLEQSFSGDTITVTLAQVQYSIAVTTEDIDGVPSQVTVTLYSGDDAVPGASDLPLVEGVATVTVVAGNYTARLNGVASAEYSYEYASLTASKRSASIKLIPAFTRLAVGSETVVSFEDEYDEIVIRLTGTVDGQYYAIAVTSDADDFNDHNFTISYNGTSDTLGKDKHEAEADSFIVIVISDGVTHFVLKADAAFANVTVSVSEYEVRDPDIELDTAKTIYKTDTYHFTAAQYGYYKIEAFDYETLDSFGISLGEGEAIGKGSGNSDAYATFYAEADALFEVSIYIYNGKSITVKITHLPDGDFTLGDWRDVVIPAGDYNSTKVQLTFTAPVKGLYRMEITSDVATGSELLQKAYVRNDTKNDVFILAYGSEPYATFEAAAGDSITFGFYKYFVNDEFTLKAIITLVEIIPDTLAVGGTATIKPGEDADSALSIPLEGVKNGKSYVVYITDYAGVLAMNYTYYLVYQGETILFTEYEYEEGQYMKHAVFTAGAEKALKVYTDATTAIWNITLALEEIGGDGAEGPQVGEDCTVTPGLSEGEAVELTFEGFVVGATYTLKLYGDKDMGVYGLSYTLIYDSEGHTVEFAYPADSFDYFEATFTANANTGKVKLYGVRMMGFGPVAPVTVEIIKVVVPKTVAVGDSCDVTPGDGKSAAVELPFEGIFVIGHTYTIQLTTEGAAWNYTYLLICGDTEVQFSYSDSDLLATFTATDTTVKFYSSEHYGFFGPADLVEVHLEIIADLAPAAGPAVGDTCTVTPGTTADSAVELSFAFVEGTTYTLKLTGNADDGFYFFEYTLVYGSGKTVAFTVGDGCYEVTFTATGETVKLFGANWRNASAPGIEVVAEITNIS